MYHSDSAPESGHDLEKLSTLKSMPTFEGWDEVPKAYKTRSAWQSAFRRVKKGETPEAVVVLPRIRKLETIDAEQEIVSTRGLFHIGQTSRIRKTPLNTSRHEFYRIFGQRADRTRHIRWTKGGWMTDDEGRYWDSNVDAWGWRTYPAWLGKQTIVDHLRGKELVGVFGSKTSSYLMLDVDLHKQPLSLFLRRLAVLLDRFHGRHRCHFQVSDEKAGGVHLFLYFGKQSRLATRREWITRQLWALHQQHPDCEFFEVESEKRKLNLEIFPSTSHGHRLPLARGRTMLLDRPMALIQQRGRTVQDVAKYMNWLADPERVYMEKEEVYEYIMARLDRTCSSPLSDRKNGVQSESPPKRVEVEPRSQAGGEDGPSSKGTSGPVPLRGKTRQAIVGYWLRGEAQHFRHLNSAILVTMRALQAEGVNKDRAVEIVTGYAEDLPNKEVSSRLTGDVAGVRRDIIRAAEEVWREAEGGKAGQKWAEIDSHWGKSGFRVSDKATWTLVRNALEVIVDCEQIEFNQDERDLIVKKLCPVLVGRKQAAKQGKQEEVVRAVAFFLRYVRCCPREIPRAALPKILSGYKLKLGNNDKQAGFLKVLLALDWIYIRADYHCPAQYGKTGRGRARAYGIGSAMVSKFGLPPPDKERERLMDLYSVSHFLRDAEIEVSDGGIAEVCEPWPD